MLGSSSLEGAEWELFSFLIAWISHNTISIVIKLIWIISIVFSDLIQSLYSYFQHEVRSTSTFLAGDRTVDSRKIGTEHWPLKLNVQFYESTSDDYYAKVCECIALVFWWNRYPAMGFPKRRGELYVCNFAWDCRLRLITKRELIIGLRTKTPCVFHALSFHFQPKIMTFNHGRRLGLKQSAFLTIGAAACLRYVVQRRDSGLLMNLAFISSCHCAHELFTAFFCRGAHALFVYLL